MAQEGREEFLLPVTALAGNIMQTFLDESDGFKEIYLREIRTNRLKEQIGYMIFSEKVKEVATISNDRQIILYENYNQFLWCICYALLTVYVEGYEKPLKSGTYLGELDDKNIVKEAYMVLSQGLSLLREYSREPFYGLPNPQTRYEGEYVGMANGIFCASMRYILLHEFAHQYYGHHSMNATGEQAKENELEADDYAIEFMAKSFNKDTGRTFKLGAIAGMFSLFLLGEQLDGGSHHPDLDRRLLNTLEKLTLHEMDDLWGVASMGIKLWAVKYDKKIHQEQSYDTTKEMFDHFFGQLEQFKK